MRVKIDRDHDGWYFYGDDLRSEPFPFVSPGKKYRSLWWFQTVAERDRFLRWTCDRKKV